MRNPFDWILEWLKSKLINETKDMTYLCHAFRQTKEYYDSAKQAPPELSKKNEDLFGQSIDFEGLSQERDRVFPLDFSTLMLTELLFKEDLRNVRIHTGAEADRRARYAGADAITSGRDIYFRDGMFHPGSEEGKNLLLHELQHAVQFQKGSSVEYEEDREQLEFEAEKRESDSEGQELHSNGYGGITSDSMEESSTKLQEFSKKQPEFLRIIDKSGKSYLIKAEDRQKVIESASKLVSQKLNLEWDYMDEDMQKRIMNRLSGGQL